MATMPKTMRLSAFSLKTTQAKTAVSTDSRLSINDAADPDEDVNPYINATGPKTPPKKMAPRSHGHARA